MATAVKARKTKSMDMTEGTIWKQLIYFAFPLLIGNLFQQLYNTVDSVVVGNFVSTEALAAVGSVTPIINMLVGFFSGLATGAGVVISQFFGAKNGPMLHKAVHTTLIMTVALGVVFTFIGIFMTPLMLNLMSTPADVFDGAALYLRIYFGGVLILSSLLNVVLDLTFVIVFHMGIAGVAIATIIAQFISAFLLLVVLARSHEDYRLVLWPRAGDAPTLVALPDRTRYSVQGGSYLGPALLAVDPPAGAETSQLTLDLSSSWGEEYVFTETADREEGGLFFFQLYPSGGSELEDGMSIQMWSDFSGLMAFAGYGRYGEENWEWFPYTLEFFDGSGALIGTYDNPAAGPAVSTS